MARPREFDIEIALDGALDVFWDHGYNGSTLPLLLDGMSLTRGSLYKAFSDKKSLFLLVLKHYEEMAVVPAVDLLKNDEIGDGMDRISRLFQLVVEAVKNGDHRGCLLCSTAAGAAAEDAEISSAVREMLLQIRQAFEAALKKTNKYCRVKPKNRRELADMLLTQYVGLRVLARSNASDETLESSITSLMRLLNSPQGLASGKKLGKGKSGP